MEDKYREDFAAITLKTGCMVNSQVMKDGIYVQLFRRGEHIPHYEIFCPYIILNSPAFVFAFISRYERRIDAKR